MEIVEGRFLLEEALVLIAGSPFERYASDLGLDSAMLTEARSAVRRGLLDGDFDVRAMRRTLRDAIGEVDADRLIRHIVSLLAGGLWMWYAPLVRASRHWQTSSSLSGDQIALPAALADISVVRSVQFEAIDEVDILVAEWFGPEGDPAAAIYNAMVERAVCSSLASIALLDAESRQAITSAASEEAIFLNIPLPFPRL